jgi:tRNA threonylcarbamoyladenosine modification (KEOPS) complex  Pcc1 subunit
MPMKKQLIASIALALASITASADVDDAMLGKYTTSSDAESNQEYQVSVTLTKRNTDLGVLAAVVWQPGVSCTIDLDLQSNNVTKTIESDGQARYSVRSDFEDSFHNRGILSLNVKGNTCILTLTATDEVDKRATRQYDSYILARVSGP